MPRVRLPARLPAPLAGDDDRALVARFAAARDDAAFAALVGRHARMVYGVCRRTVRDGHLAEDAFQATFLVLARHPARAAAAASVGGWLFGIARRVGLAARRHEDRRSRRAGGVSPLITVGNQGADTPRSPDFDDLLRALDEELSALPDDCRAALVACFLDERTQDEAACQLGWSLSTLRRRLDRGKELLRARLTRRGVTLAAGLFAAGLARSASAAVPVRLLDATTPAAGSPLAAALAAEAARGLFTAKVVLAVAAGVAVAVGGLAVAVADRARPAEAAPPVPQFVAAPIPQERKPWAAVTGRVVYPGDGPLPKPRLVPVGMIKDADFFPPAGELTYGDVVVDPKTRGLANAVVWLRPDSDDRNDPFPPDRIHTTYRDARPREHRVECGRGGFTPRVVAARAGDRLVYANPTPIPFNVQYDRYPTSDRDPPGVGRNDFNVLLPPKGQEHLAPGRGQEYVTDPLPALRSADHVKDNIHRWVVGCVWAFDHPYFAVTDAEGRFAIPDAPAGAWRLMAWHEKVGWRHGPKGRLGERVVVPAGGRLDLKALAHESDLWAERQDDP
jgi:RNA polymerase sigma factor (sigma-70 family)